jgi:hypothetical protein
MANLVLNQYIPDIWYDIYRKRIDEYINHFGQEVRMLKRTETTYNIYSDIVRDVSVATTVTAIINRTPIESFFAGPPLIYPEEEMISGYFAYFKRDSLVRVDDIIIIEGKSIEGDVELDAFEVVAIKGKRLEQEFIRKYILSPFRDRSSEAYENQSVLTEDELIETHAGDDVVSDPGGFTDKYYDTTKVVPSPGTENFITPSFEPGQAEEYDDVYKIVIPDSWKDGTPYDVGKPVNRNSDS